MPLKMSRSEVPDNPDPDHIYELAVQPGAQVTLSGGDVVIKTGYRVRQAEELAMNAVKKYTAVPVPKVHFFVGGTECGTLAMELAHGRPLDFCWNELEDYTKVRICHQVWSYIRQWREIPKPEHLQHLYVCLADGSASKDVLLASIEESSGDLVDDSDVKERIFSRYYHYYGRRYNREQILSMLPSSSRSVFTHGDIAPRNIMVDKDFQITGILDWENAGWYPDYWEFVNIQRPSRDIDWMNWMAQTVPDRHDLEGIKAVRRVLF